MQVPMNESSEDEISSLDTPSMTPNSNKISKTKRTKLKSRAKLDEMHSQLELALKENEQLQALASRLESEKRQIGDKLQGLETPLYPQKKFETVRAKEKAMAENILLKSEKERLQEEVRVALERIRSLEDQKFPRTQDTQNESKGFEESDQIITKLEIEKSQLQHTLQQQEEALAKLKKEFSSNPVFKLNSSQSSFHLPTSIPTTNTTVSSSSSPTSDVMSPSSPVSTSSSSTPSFSLPKKILSSSTSSSLTGSPVPSAVLQSLELNLDELAFQEEEEEQEVEEEFKGENEEKNNDGEEEEEEEEEHSPIILSPVSFSLQSIHHQQSHRPSLMMAMKTHSSSDTDEVLEGGGEIEVHLVSDHSLSLVSNFPLPSLPIDWKGELEIILRVTNASLESSSSSSASSSSSSVLLDVHSLIEKAFPTTTTTPTSSTPFSSSSEMISLLKSHLSLCPDLERRKELEDRIELIQSLFPHHVEEEESTPPANSSSTSHSIAPTTITTQPVKKITPPPKNNKPSGRRYQDYQQRIQTTSASSSSSSSSGPSKPAPPKSTTSHPPTTQLKKPSPPPMVASSSTDDHSGQLSETEFGQGTCANICPIQ